MDEKILVTVHIIVYSNLYSFIPWFLDYDVWMVWNKSFVQEAYGRWGTWWVLLKEKEVLKPMLAKALLKWFLCCTGMIVLYSLFGNVGILFAVGLGMVITKYM